MKIAKTLAAGIALAFAMPAMAQDEGDASYEDSMRCAALYLYAADVIGEGDPAAGPILEERATRWIAMAMLRDGADGVRADGELQSVVDALVEKIVSLGEDEEAQNRFAVEQFAQCDALEAANAEEFASFEFEDAE